MVPGLKDLSYSERLQRLNLPTLEERRQRGDMIMLYKCVNGIDWIDKNEFITPAVGRTRGHSRKLARKRTKKDVRKFSFPQRAIEQWNSLPEDVVTATSIHKFKAKYDKLRTADGTPRA